jgi:hypothetical protein
MIGTAFLDPARHVKARLLRILFGHKPNNFRPRDRASLERDVSYALQVSGHYAARLRSLDVEVAGCHIMELGPGTDFGAQLVLASQGANITVADRFLAPWDEGYHPAFYRLLRSRIDGPAAPLDLVIAANRYPDNAIQQIAHSIETIREGSYDCVLSNAVLEHVSDLREAAKNLFAITKPGGINIHQIDFHDHRSHEQPLEFLLLDDAEQEALFNEWHGETGNRARLSEAIMAFTNAGFFSCAPDNITCAEPQYFATFLPRLRQAKSRYRDWDEHDLRVTGACLVMKR